MLKRPDFIITLESALCFVMSLRKTLSVSLQSPDIDVSKAGDQGQTSMITLQQMELNARSELKAIHANAAKLASSVGAKITVSRVTMRQNYRRNCKSSSPEEYYFVPVFLKLVDHYISQYSRWNQLCWNHA